MRIRLLVIVFALIAVSCGGSGAESGSPFTTAPTTASPSTDAPTTEAPSTTGGGSTDAPATSPAPVDRPPTEGPAAPAFTTVLSDGTEFNLAAEQNPVYLVFWAEW